MHMGECILGGYKGKQAQRKVLQNAFRCVFLLFYTKAFVKNEWWIFCRNVNRNVKSFKNYLTKLYYCIIVLFR